MIVCAALVVPPDSSVYVPEELAHRMVGLDYGNGTAYAGLQMLEGAVPRDAVTTCAAVTHPGERYAAMMRGEFEATTLITARDPEDGALEYRLAHGSGEPRTWTEGATLSYTVTEQYIAENVGVELMVRSKRPHHAQKVFDDAVTFGYRVLPPRGR